MMPKNIDVLRKMNSTELADFLATEREKMVRCTLSGCEVEMQENIHIAVRAVIKNWLEREVDC